MVDTGARERQIADAREWLALIDGLNKTTGMQEAERLVKGLLALAAGVGVPPDEGYGMKQRRRAQAAEDTLTDFREAARGAFNGVRGTSRTTDSDDVKVTFTDRGWEACKRLFALAGVGVARPAEPRGEFRDGGHITIPWPPKPDARAKHEKFLGDQEMWRARFDESMGPLNELADERVVRTNDVPAFGVQIRFALAVIRGWWRSRRGE